MTIQKDSRSEDRLVAQVNKIVDLVDYQDRAVVSRTIINKKTGTVTFFAFAQGEGLSEHTAPFDALVEVVEGTVEVIISGKPKQVSAGEMILMPANEPHALLAVTPFKMMLILIRQ